MVFTGKRTTHPSENFTSVSVDAFTLWPNALLLESLGSLKMAPQSL